MANDVEVLRWFLAHGDLWGPWRASRPAHDGEEVRGAISAAISALEAREAQPKAEGRMSDGRLALERHYRANADLLTTRAAAQALIDIDHDAARASEAALKEEARHWEAKWLQEKMNGKKALEETRQEMARQAGVIEIQRRTEEVAKNDALRDLYEAQEKLETAQKRIGELEKALAFVRVDLEMWLAWSETGHLKTSGPLPGENPVPDEWRSLLKMLRSISPPSKPETP